MKTSRKTSAARAGSVLLIAVVMLGFASFTIGAILTATMTYARNSERVYCRDKAAYLADAGLQAAVIRLNEEMTANISYTESKAYFSQLSSFIFPDWGFETKYILTNSNYRLVSTGRYNGHHVIAQCGLTNTAGSTSIHAIYILALYAGNSSGVTNYSLSIGGTGNGADYVKGDTYSGDKIAVSGTAKLRHPEILCDTNANQIADEGEKWTNAYATQTFTNSLSAAAFAAYKTAQSTNLSKAYNNGQYDAGEAYLDTIGNGVYNADQDTYTDANGNGRWDTGDSYVDRNSNGVYNAGIDTVVDNGNGRYDAGEEWVEDTDALRRTYRTNGKYDRAGGYYSGSTWKTTYRVNYQTRYCTDWPAEQYMDVGDGVYSPAETYVDRNGMYDEGEEYVDDRNAFYDYGTQAKRAVTGMPAPGPGQKAATGNNPAIDPPNLTNMYYYLPKTTNAPGDALTRWGYDVIVNSNVFGTAKAIVDTSKPQHIFVRNPPSSAGSSVSSAGKTIKGRTYTAIKKANGTYLDDYFLEDPSDSFYNSGGDSSMDIDGTVYTAPQYLNVRDSGNNALYFVDGNLYLHNPDAYAFRFRQPGTRITIVANGNITISDEFYYNAAYAAGLVRTNVNSTIVHNPSDALCLIALKNPAAPTNTGNIFIGDAQFGTGGSIHALLYAENDFVDNNLNTSDQAFISIFGNMTAGNHVRLNRTTGSGVYRTRLDITLDERVRDNTIIIPGLPHPVGHQRRVPGVNVWCLQPGTWSSYSFLK